MADPLVIAIVGPTCTGKTRIAIELAKLINGEIISADARQIYKLINIGTAKPTRDELSEVPHHLVDVLSLDDEMSAGVYGKIARDAVEGIFSRNHKPLIVGGSGLYLRAVIDGLFESPDVDCEIRESLRRRFNEDGAESLLAELNRVDPAAAKGLLPQNYKRILRALEVFYSSGERISELRQARPLTPNFRTLQFGILLERKLLYRRIENRVDDMIEQGLVDEVKEILKRGFEPSVNSLQTVGYKEVINYLQGKIKFEEMVDLIKMNTRRYAKRQMTWFRKDNRIVWIKADNRSPKEIAKEILERFTEGPYFSNPSRI